jgi:hypothetical protein
VLTHLARNADGHARPLDGALRGEDVPRYPDGSAQRSNKIDAGAPRPAADIIADLVTSQHRLELAWERSTAASWPHPELRGDDHWPTTASPARRLREVGMHHVDLGLATSRLTGPATASRGNCPGSWPRSPPGCSGARTPALSWRGCQAGGRPRQRSSSIHGDGRTQPHRPGLSAPLHEAAGNPDGDTLSQELRPHDGRAGRTMQPICTAWGAPPVCRRRVQNLIVGEHGHAGERWSGPVTRWLGRIWYMVKDGSRPAGSWRRPAGPP